MLASGPYSTEEVLNSPSGSGYDAATLQQQQQHQHQHQHQHVAGGAADHRFADACSADSCLMNPGLTCPDVYMALQDVQFMAEHTRREQYTIRVNHIQLYRSICTLYFSIPISFSFVMYTIFFSTFFNKLKKI